MQDGGGGEQHVQGGADQTEGLSVDPVLGDQVDRPERHHQHGHHQVGERQRDDEVVGLDFPAGERERFKSSLWNFSVPLWAERRCK